MKIYIENASETEELLFLMKGFRHDVFVEVDGERYIVRLDGGAV